MFFSLLFFITFIIELFFGVMVIYLNPKGKLNRQFLLISIALCFWSFGFCMSNSADNKEIALFWRRISAIGWTGVYAMLLHMLLILTGKNQILSKKQYILFYLPALISIYVFSISEKISKGQYNLIKGPHGWFNVAVNNAWDLFFYVYYISYILVGIGLLIHWRKTSDNHQRKQANIMLGAIISITILGTLTDIILNATLKGPIPQIAPIFNIIPVVSVLYSLKHNSYMKESMGGRDELILTSESRIKLYFSLSILFLSGGTITFLSYFFPRLIGNSEIIQINIYVSGLLYLIGITILLLQLIEKESFRDFLILGVTLISIPITTLLFIDYATITVWAFPLILVIISLVFNSKLILRSIILTAIITQLVVFLYAPTDVVHMDKFDYFLRIGIFIIAYGIGTIINRLYVNRLKESINKTNSQKLISKVSYEFVTASKDNIDEKIKKMLEDIGSHFNIDRSYIWIINPKDNTLLYSYEWNREGISSGLEATRYISLDKFQWWIKQLKDNKLIYIEDVNELPNEAALEKELLLSISTQSTVVIPMESNSGLMGFIGFDSINAFKKWHHDDINLLNILANILSDGLIKIKSEKEIEYMAYYDYLTELPNRTLFTNRLNQALAAAKRNKKLIAIIFMDLDGFKIINDTIGHSGGDELLKKVSKNLTDLLRKTDTVARFGGDEFLLLIDNIENFKDITKIADKIMDTFKNPFIIEEHEFFVTASAGISVYPTDGEDAEALIKNADTAMYKAKANGKNKYIMCTEDMKKEVKHNMVLSNHLFRAVEKGEMTLYYQPQISFKTGKFIGLEALLRWNHPQFGAVPPDTFIPLSEKNGSINKIGEWVLKTACIQNKKWQDMGLLYTRVGVNLSVIQFNDPFIVEKIEKILKDSQLNPKYLDLEITESVAIRENANVVYTLNNLKKLGVSISIDDFGTEYSSLSRLKLLPIDRIKIDMQFVHGIEGSQKDRAITNVIINLAKSLNLDVIAEGVESQGQIEFLNQKMCDEAQGFYYYKPMPADELEAILKEQLNAV